VNTNQCPSCGCSQPDGILCHDDVTALETMLAAVPQLIDQLDVAITRQACVTSGGKAGKGSAHERSPLNWAALEARDHLEAEVAIWGTDIAALRRDPDAGNAITRIGKAIKGAYRAIDRMQERQYLGICYYEEDGLTCHAEIWARPGAHQVTCTQCGITHDVGERRAWLLRQARDMIVTVREASRYVGEIGHIRVTEASIRGYIHRKRLTYRHGTSIRLGDLLTVVLDDSERRTA
jgi:hypothetical protein